MANSDTEMNYFTQNSGPDGDYGNQRAWGTVGWGLMGPISGLLIDLYSGDKYGKDYLPAFLILFVLGSFGSLSSVGV